MTPPPAARFPRRAPRPVPARPAPARPATRSARALPGEPAAARTAASPPEPTPTERARVRRLVRGVLIGVIVAQSVALVLVLSPSARAQFAVIDTAVLQAVVRFDGNVGRLFSTANDYLRSIRNDMASLEDLANENNAKLGSSNQAYVDESDIDDVTTTPLGLSYMSAGDGNTGISFADDDPVGALAEVVPGAVPWDDYTQQRRASTDMVLLSLRGGMQALHDFNRSIQDDSRIMSISQEARNNSVSERQLQQLQIQAQLEVARQVQALRAQQALQTSLYAVTESHRVGLDGRQFAQDTAVDCDVLTSILGIPLGGNLCDSGIAVPAPTE